MLPPALLLVLSLRAVAATQPTATAIKRQLPDSNEKILAEHLAFEPSSFHGQFSSAPEDHGTARFYPPFARHVDDQREGLWRRAAQALALLERRATCPAGMISCDGSGSPNKCCQQGTYCTSVPDADVGRVACCPNGSTCGGGVGTCPSDATSCPAALGGGCCIPGYVCQGVGCVPGASATPTPVLPTSESHETITSTKTTTVQGSPSTVIVTVTLTASPVVITQTATQVVTPPSTLVNTRSESVPGNPPWRPTASGSSELTSAPESTPLTQTGCPTGFYGCLATHGGGCCRTDRDCQTYSCPAPSATRLVSNGITVVVPATNVPASAASATCAGGWFMCSADAGAKLGCCPSGYECGSASCFTSAATETGKVQKQSPSQSSTARAGGISLAAYSAVILALAVREGISRVAK